MTPTDKDLEAARQWVDGDLKYTPVGTSSFSSFLAGVAYEREGPKEDIERLHKAGKQMLEIERARYRELEESWNTHFNAMIYNKTMWDKECESTSELIKYLSTIIEDRKQGNFDHHDVNSMFGRLVKLLAKYREGVK